MWVSPVHDKWACPALFYVLMDLRALHLHDYWKSNSAYTSDMVIEQNSVRL